MAINIDKIHHYYKNAAIQQRMDEFLCTDAVLKTGATFISRCDYPCQHTIEPYSVSDLFRFLSNGMEICRSLWDQNALLAHLDIEYVNFDYPAEPYLDPLRIFGLQQPLVREIERLLLSFNISPLHLLSGRGHHFIWRIPRQGSVFKRLMQLAHVSEPLLLYYSSHSLMDDKIVDEQLARAYAGLGLVMEYFVHRIKEIAGSFVQVPIKLTDVVVQSGEHGREIISLDISEYADPLNTRAIRIPFSVYLKPWHKEGILHGGISEKVMPLVLIPLHEMDVDRGILIMQELERCSELAERAGVRIPDSNEAMNGLIDEYLRSTLVQFHNYFYSQHHDGPEKWPGTYDRTDLEQMPFCVAHILKNPNDLLLKPAGIELVVRTLLAQQWHPRHIAGLIRSKYERNYGWGNYWYTYDASLRADFYVRMFGGLVAAGLETLNDYTCESTKEKGFCFDTSGACKFDSLDIKVAS